jgi:hypothetical protein
MTRDTELPAVIGRMPARAEMYSIARRARRRQRISDHPDGPLQPRAAELKATGAVMTRCELGAPLTAPNRRTYSPTGAPR